MSATIEHTMLETLACKSTLAEGVLDGGEALAKAKLKRGADAHLARLRQMLAPELPAAAARKPALPPDPARAFAAQAAGLLGPALLHCHESFLPGDAAPVLLAVVADHARGRLSALQAMHEESLWPGDRPALHILDQSTWEAIQQLAASGLITFNPRAARPLTEAAPSLPAPPPLTPEELQRIAALREHAAKKDRVAAVLIAEGLNEEAVPHQQAAALARAQAEAIETRQPVPERIVG